MAPVPEWVTGKTSECRYLHGVKNALCIGYHEQYVYLFIKINCSTVCILALIKWDERSSGRRRTGNSTLFLLAKLFILDVLKASLMSINLESRLAEDYIFFFIMSGPCHFFFIF